MIVQIFKFFDLDCSGSNLS